MNDIAISVENLGKKFLIGAPRSSDLRTTLTTHFKNFFSDNNGTHSEFWALKEINFDVRKGDAVGIVGRNGAGKSTLLKILSRITTPTTGRFEITGRVSSLLEVGTGFHPELTGRENIFLNGTILGMKRREIKEKFDRIVDFSGIEKFIDTPVKHYSSGMKVRLAFSVAAHLEPEILIVDEVLAVGDAEFQKKCIGKMDEVTRTKERVVIFVSHNMSALKTLCRNGIFLDNGQIQFKGDIDRTVDAYLSTTHAQSNIQSVQNFPLSPQCILSEFRMGANNVEELGDLNFKIVINSSERNSISELSLLFYSELQERIAIIDLRDEQLLKVSEQNSHIVVEGLVNNLPLVEGSYNVGLYLVSHLCSGNFLDIVTLPVTGRKTAIAPYPANARGYIEMNKQFRIYA
jgi:lipopolysaccharide transport system ATP-binding protein